MAMTDLKPTLSDLIRIGVLLVTVIGAYFMVDKRVTANATSIERQVVVDQRQDELREELKRDISARLNRIEDKIDRLIERPR